MKYYTLRSRYANGTETWSRLRKIRLSMGLYQRTERDNYTTHNEGMREAIRKMIASGQGQRYGRKLAYSHLRALGVPVARDRMHDILQQERRKAGLPKFQFGKREVERTEFITPGPN
jgi:hypothetical protein